MGSFATTVIANAKKTKGVDLESLFSFVKDHSLLDINLTENMEDAYKVISKLPEDISNIIVSYGGDGTLNGVVNAIMQSGKNNQVYIVVVPYKAGKKRETSGNDFARPGLNISNLEEGTTALKTFLKDENKAKYIIKSNVGLVTCGDLSRYFINTAGVGLSVNGIKWREKLKVSYTVGAILAAFLNKSMELKMRINGISHIDDNKKLVNINNTPEFGNGLLIAPEAQIDDGYFNATILYSCNPITTLLLLSKIKRKTKKDIEYVFDGGSTKIGYYNDVKEIILKTDKPIPFQTDGEIIEKKDLGFRENYEYVFRILNEKVPFIARR